MEDKSIYLTKVTGEPIGPFTKDEAQSMVANKADRLHVSTDKELQDYYQAQQHTSPAEQVLTGLEQGTQAATFGAAKPVLGAVEEMLAPGTPEQKAISKEQYLQGMEERAQKNPNAALIGQVGGFFADPFGAIGETTKLGERAIEPLVAKEAQSFLGKVAQAGIKGFGQGAAFGAANYTVPTFVEDKPFSADAFFDSVVKDATNFGAFHGIGQGVIEAAGKIKEVKLGALKNIHKVVEKGETAPLADKVTTMPVEFDHLGGGEQFGRRATTFDIETKKATEINPEDPTQSLDENIYTHTERSKSGERKTKLNDQNIVGQGLDLMSDTGLQQAGDKFGIRDFDVKFKNLRLPEEETTDFIKRIKESQVKQNFLNRLDYEGALPEKSQSVLAEYEKSLDMLKFNPENEQFIEDFQNAQSNLDNHISELKGELTPQDIENNQVAIDSAIQSMKNELSGVEAGKRFTFETKNEIGDIEKKTIGQKSTFPEWWKELNKETKTSKDAVLKAIESGKGKVFERVKQIAIDDLERGNPNYSEWGYKSKGVLEGEIGKTLDRELERSANEIGGVFDTVDYVKSDGQLHVFNPEAVQGELTQAIQTFTKEAQGVLKELNIPEESLSSQKKSVFNKVATYIKEELMPKSADDLAPGQHTIDYIAEKNKTNLMSYGAQLENVVNAAVNRLERSGINTRLTNSQIADYIENHVLPRFSDPLTGNPVPEMVEQYNEIKQYAQSYRDTGYTLDKYGNKVYQPIKMQELRNLRISLDKMVDWDGATSNGVQEAAKQLRDHIEKHIINTLGENDAGLKNEYIKAKENVHMALQTNDIIGQATVKSIEKATKGSKNVLGAMIGGKLGGAVGGLPGYIVGSVLGSGQASKAIGMLDTVNSAIKGHLSNLLNETVEKYGAQINRAALGIMSEKAVSYPISKPIANKTYDSIKQDAKKLQEAKQGQVDYFNSFMDRNSALQSVAPQSMPKMIEKAIKANDFLLSKIPQNPYQNIPWREDKWEPSQMEIAKYFRFKEAVQKPSTILNQLQNGYVTPEAIEVLNAVYPETKQELQTKILSNLNPKKQIPQEKRVTLFKVFGIPLDNYTSGALFMQMQSNANGMVVQEAQEQGKPINTSKLSDPLKNTTQGTASLREQD